MSGGKGMTVSSSQSSLASEDQRNFSDEFMDTYNSARNEARRRNGPKVSFAKAGAHGDSNPELQIVNNGGTNIPPQHRKGVSSPRSPRGGSNKKHMNNAFNENGRPLEFSQEDITFSGYHEGQLVSKSLKCTNMTRKPFRVQISAPQTKHFWIESSLLRNSTLAPGISFTVVVYFQGPTDKNLVQPYHDHLSVLVEDEYDYRYKGDVLLHALPPQADIHFEEDTTMHLIHTHALEPRIGTPRTVPGTPAMPLTDRTNGQIRSAPGMVNFGAVVPRSRLVRTVTLLNMGQLPGKWKIVWEGEGDEEGDGVAEATGRGKVSKFLQASPAEGILGAKGKRDDRVTVTLTFIAAQDVLGAFRAMGRVMVGSHSPPLLLDITANIVEQSLELLRPQKAAFSGAPMGSDGPLRDVHFDPIFFGQERKVQALLVNHSPAPSTFVVNAGSTRVETKGGALGGGDNGDGDKANGGGGQNGQRANGLKGSRSDKGMTSEGSDDPEGRNAQSAEKVDEIIVIPTEGRLEPYSQIIIEFTFKPQLPTADSYLLQGYKNQKSQRQPLVQDYMRSITFGTMEGKSQIVVPVSGRGVEPVVTLSQYCFDFGSCPVYDRRDMVCSMKNPGDQLPIAFSFSSTAHFHTKPQQGILAPLQSQEILFSFVPDSLGSFEKEINLTLAGIVDEFLGLPKRRKKKSTWHGINHEPRVELEEEEDLSRINIRTVSLDVQGSSATYLDGHVGTIAAGVSRRAVTGGVDKLPNDFEPTFKFIEGGSPTKKGMGAGGDKFERKAGWSEEEHAAKFSGKFAVVKERIADSKYTWNTEEVKTRLEHRQFYSGYLGRVRKERMGKAQADLYEFSMSNPDLAKAVVLPKSKMHHGCKDQLVVHPLDPVSLGLGFAQGLKDIDPGLPQREDRLVLPYPLEIFYEGTLKPSEETLLQAGVAIPSRYDPSKDKRRSKLKLVPTTQAERKDCETALSHDELAKIIRGPKDIEFGRQCVNAVETQYFTVRNCLQSHILVELQLPPALSNQKKVGGGGANGNGAASPRGSMAKTAGGGSGGSGSGAGGAGSSGSLTYTAMAAKGDAEKFADMSVMEQELSKSYPRSIMVCPGETSSFEIKLCCDRPQDFRRSVHYTINGQHSFNFFVTAEIVPMSLHAHVPLSAMPAMPQIDTPEPVVVAASNAKGGKGRGTGKDAAAAKAAQDSAGGDIAGAAGRPTSARPGTAMNVMQFRFDQSNTGFTSVERLFLENEFSIPAEFWWTHHSDFFSVSPVKGTVPPGGSLPIEFTYAPRTAHKMEDNEFTLYVKNGPSKKIICRAELEANVVDFREPNVELGKVPAGIPVSHSVILKNSSSTRSVVKLVEPVAPGVQVSPSFIVLEPYSSEPVTVTIIAKLPAVEAPDDVSATRNAGDNIKSSALATAAMNKGVPASLLPHSIENGVIRRRTSKTAEEIAQMTAQAEALAKSLVEEEKKKQELEKKKLTQFSTTVSFEVRGRNVEAKPLRLNIVADPVMSEVFVLQDEINIGGITLGGAPGKCPLTLVNNGRIAVTVLLDLRAYAKEFNLDISSFAADVTRNTDAVALKNANNRTGMLAAPSVHVNAQGVVVTNVKCEGSKVKQISAADLPQSQLDLMAIKGNNNSNPNATVVLSQSGDDEDREDDGVAVAVASPAASASNTASVGSSVALTATGSAGPKRGKKNARAEVRLADKLWAITVSPGSKFYVGDITFVPLEVKEFAFELPLFLQGAAKFEPLRRVVAAKGLKPKISLKSSTIDFSDKVLLDQKRAVLNPYVERFTMKNEDDMALFWMLRLKDCKKTPLPSKKNSAGSTGKDGEHIAAEELVAALTTPAFRVEPSQGVLQGGQACTVTTCFFPTQTGDFSNDMELHLFESESARTRAVLVMQEEDLEMERFREREAKLLEEKQSADRLDPNKNKDDQAGTMSSGSGSPHGDNKATAAPSALAPPYLFLQLKGVSSQPTIKFDVDEAVLPLVPLDVNAACVFNVINVGFDALELRCLLPQDTKVPLKVSFPEGHTLGTEKQVLPVHISFMARKPISLTTKVEFVDPDGQVFGVIVHGVADNSILTTQPYLDARKGQYKVVPSKAGRAVTLLESEPALDKNTELQANGSAMVVVQAPAHGGYATTTPAVYVRCTLEAVIGFLFSQGLVPSSVSQAAAEARAGAQPRPPQSNASTGVLGSPYEFEKGEGARQATKAGGFKGKKALSETGHHLVERPPSVLPITVEDFITGMAKDGGKGLKELLKALSGKNPLEKKKRNNDRRKDPLLDVLDDFRVVNNFLRQWGAVLGDVHPWDYFTRKTFLQLLALSDFTAMLSLQVAEYNINMDGIYEDKRGGSGGGSMGGSGSGGAKKDDGPSINPALLQQLAMQQSQKPGSASGKEGGELVDMQMPNMLSAHQVADMKRRMEENFEQRSLFSWMTVLMQAVKVFSCSRATLKSFKAMPGISQDAAKIEGTSNVYSSAEQIVLNWLSYHFTQQNPNAAFQLTTFDADLQSGVAIAAVIESHVPTHAIKHLNVAPTTVAHYEDNWRKILAVLDRLGLKYMCSAEQMARPIAAHVFLFCFFLYQRLPAFIPQQTITLVGKLQEEVVKYIELSNPGKATITYTVQIDGSSGFYVKSNKVTLEAKGGAKVPVPVFFKARFVRPAEARLTFICDSVTVNGSQGAGSSIVFNLKVDVVESKPIMTINTVGKVYDHTKVDVRVTNPFTADCQLIVAVLPTGEPAGANLKALNAAVIDLVKNPDRFSTKATNVMGARPEDGGGIGIGVGGMLGGSKSSSTASLPGLQKPLGGAKGQAAVVPKLPTAFWCRSERLRLKVGETQSLSLNFMPWKVGAHKCHLILMDDVQGEMIIEIVAEALSPAPTETLKWNTGSKNTEGRDIDVPTANSTFNKARTQAIQRLATSKKQSNILAGGGSGGSGDKKGAAEEDPFVKEGFLPQQLHYVCTSSSPFFTVSPACIVDASMLKGGKNWHSLDESSKAKWDALLNKVKLKFNPRGAGLYRADITLEGLYDTRVFALECTAASQEATPTLEFHTPARKSSKQDIPLFNNSDETWEYKSNLTGKHFSGPPTVVIEPHGRASYWLTFAPSWLGKFSGLLELTNTKTGERCQYDLEGYGEDPLPDDHVKVEMQARTTVTKSVTLSNPSSTTPIMYQVETDLPFISGVSQVQVPQNGKVDYVFTVMPPLGGTFFGSLTFMIIGPEKQYVWYSIEIAAAPPKPEQKLEVVATLRAAAEVDIEVVNPLNEVVSLEVQLQGEGLRGNNTIELGPRETGMYTFTFNPLAPAGTAEGAVMFLHPKLGEFWYSLVLKALEPKPVDLPEFVCEVGLTTHQVLFIDNPSMDEEIILRPKADNTTNYSCKPQTLIVPPNSSGQLTVTYTPSAVDDVQEGEVRMSHPLAGDWVYRCKGKGLRPRAMKEHVITAPITTRMSSMVIFRNPFRHRLPVTISMDPDNHGLGIFSLLNPAGKPIPVGQTLSAVVPAFSVYQVPFSFTPKKIVDHTCTIYVSSASEEGRSSRASDKSRASVAAQGGKQDVTGLVWTYPIKGVAEGPVRANMPKLAITASSRTHHEMGMELVLEGLLEDVDGDDDEDDSPHSSQSTLMGSGSQLDKKLMLQKELFSVEVEVPESFRKVVANTTRVSLVQPTVDFVQRRANDIYNTRRGGGGAVATSQVDGTSIGSVTSSPRKDATGFLTPGSRAGSTHASTKNLTGTGSAAGKGLGSSQRLGAVDENKGGMGTLSATSSSSSLVPMVTVPSLQVHVVFEPLKPMNVVGSLIVSKKSGGRWRFPIELSASNAAFDDVIRIDSLVGKTATVTFSLKNKADEPAPFQAYFTSDSPIEFNVVPQSGVLKPRGHGEGTSFVVLYSPKEYGKNMVGQLVIETDEMQWTYEVRGGLPRYMPPVGQSTGQSRPATHANPMGMTGSMSKTVSPRKDRSGGVGAGPDDADRLNSARSTQGGQGGLKPSHMRRPPSHK